MKKIILTVIVLLTSTDTLLGANLVPMTHKGFIGGTIKNLNLPKKIINEDFQSGLKTVFVIESWISTDNFSSQKKQFVKEVYYDLWDEQYIIKDINTGKRLLKKSKNELVKELKSIKLYAIFPRKSLKPTKKYRLHTILAVDPIDKDRLQKLRKWVAKNSQIGQNQSISSASSSFNAIFNKIFAGYTADKSAKWKVNIISKDFSPIEVHNGKKR